MMRQDDIPSSYIPKNPTEAKYTSGDYATRYPDWHVEDSPWRAEQVLQLMSRNRMEPRTICEVGCGAGEILSQLQKRMDNECAFFGYDISPQAMRLAQGRANERLHFKLADIREEQGVYFELMLINFMLEHLEDIYAFLRGIRQKSEYKIFQLPLELSVQTVLRPSILSASYEHGHLHFFTKEIALEMLKDNDYDVLDYFYTSWTRQRSVSELVGQSSLTFKLEVYLGRLLRRLLFSANADLAVRVFGRDSIIILAR